MASFGCESFVLHGRMTASSPHFSPDGEVIAQGFGFEDFLDEWNNSGYCRGQKMSCRFNEQTKIRHSGEKCGPGRRLLKFMQ